LPAPRIPPAAEADYRYKPIFLHLEEYSLGEAPRSRTATTAVDGWELQWMFRYRLDLGLDRQRETLPEPGRMLSSHARVSSKSSLASGSQTTGGVTAY
jgi:hypothetical protein